MRAFGDKRGCERHNCESPLTIAYFNTTQYYPAKSLNYSKDGIYFEMDAPLNLDADVYIRRERVTPIDSTQEFYEGFRSVGVAKVKWCKKVPCADKLRYGIGARYYDVYY